MNVIGINAPPRGWHDTAACLVVDGRIIAFCEEERLSRVKHSVHRPPHAAVAHCLAEGGLTFDDVDVVAVGWDVAELYTQYALGKLDVNDYIAFATGQRARGRPPQVAFVPHHLAHATCAFFASPFDGAAVLVVDGIGEREATSIWAARQDGQLRCLRVWPPAQSLGLLYDSACKQVGLSALEAGKLMGLAAYGRARDIQPWPLVALAADDYRLVARMEAGATLEAVIHTWLVHFCSLAGAPRSTPIPMLHEDPVAVRVAWSAQRCIEQTVEFLSDLARRAAGRDELCIGGGVALNCAANGRLAEPVFAPPIPHDAGVALGAAWHVSPPVGKREPLNPFLGGAARPANATDTTLPVRWQPLDVDRALDWLLDGRVLGVVDGRAEVGPRALGHRSIVALPRPATQRDVVNRLKRREPWRPFAPVAPAALAVGSRAVWRTRSHLHRYMLGSTTVSDDVASLIGAAMHVDGTTRPQALDDDGSVLALLIARMAESGLPPLLLNTSFNGPGEPIVNTEAEGIATAARLGLHGILAGDRMTIVPWKA